MPGKPSVVFYVGGIFPFAKFDVFVFLYPNVAKVEDAADLRRRG